MMFKSIFKISLHTQLVSNIINKTPISSLTASQMNSYYFIFFFSSQFNVYILGALRTIARHVT